MNSSQTHINNLLLKLGRHRKSLAIVGILSLVGWGIG